MISSACIFNLQLPAHTKMETPSMASSDILKGLSQIVNTQNVQEGIDYEEIEKMYLGSVKKDEKENGDPTESFREELKNLAQKLELTFDTPIQNSRNRTPSQPALHPSPIKSRSTPTAKFTQRDTPRNTPRNISHNSPRNSPRGTSSYGTPKVSFDFDTPRRPEIYNTPSTHHSTPSTWSRDDVDDADDAHEGDADDYADHRDDRDDAQYTTPKSSGFSFPAFPSANTGVGGGGSNTRETELERRTNEQIRHDQIKGVMDEMGAKNTTIFTLEQTRRQDEKLTMLDEIASLKMSLEEDEAKGIENIPQVNNKSSYEEVENVLKSYRLINDRMRYCSLADEFILWGAQGMEELFNGKRTWFSRYNPDLTGWSKQVSVKLRRMRHETSQLVGGIMHDYNIGPGMRIVLELIPNMFMYARTKKQNYGKPTLISDSEISKAISDIRNYH